MGAADRAITSMMRTRARSAIGKEWVSEVRREPALRHEIAAARGASVHNRRVAALNRVPVIDGTRGKRSANIGLVINRVEPLQSEVLHESHRAKAPLRPEHVERNPPLIQRGQKSAKAVIQRV